MPLHHRVFQLGSPTEKQNRLWFKHLLLYKKKEIHLSRKEFALLYYLMSMPGKVFTRDEVLSKIWNNVNVTHRTIDVHIRRIRVKIGDHRIKTIKGVDYKFID
tara:strand:+ start:568 stop:876 length:309 start_codon:yes stop_codon:yes gene_type:complete